MVGRRTLVLALALTLLTASWLAPGSPLATLSPSESERSVSGEDQRKRLASIREKLHRRQALGRALGERAEELAARLERLREQREERVEALRSARDEAAHLERRIDRLVPRLSARANRLEEGRAQAGRILADLAGLSRQVEISPTTRARLLAISPLMLNRLRDADASLAALREERDALIERHRRVERDTTQLQAKGETLEHEQQRLEQQRAAALRHKARIDDEVAALRREETTIARRIIVAETAREVDAESGGRTTAAPGRAPTSAAAGAAGNAAVKGAVFGTGTLTSGIGASHAALPRLMAVAARPDLEPVVAARVDGSSFMPPPAKPGSVVTRGEVGDGTGNAAWASLSRTAALDAGAQDAFAFDLPAGRASRNPVLEPLMPLPGHVPVRLEEDAAGVHGRSVRIAAAPGQPVAAPEHGRVVFAGPFKSYGQLLIIEHDREYHILLWGFSSLDVEPNDRVETGQIVGVMAANGDAAPQLHVELRRNGRPVNPLPWLAASSSKVRG